MLTAKERLDKVLKSQSVDRPPCVCPGGMMNMITTEIIEEKGLNFIDAHNDANIMADLAEAVYDKGCFENFGVPFCMTVEAEYFGATVDLGSNIYEPHVVDYPLKSVTEWEKVAKMDHGKGRSKVVIDAIKILKSRNPKVPIIGNLTGPVSTASSIMEPVTYYKELRKKNKQAHEFMAFVTAELLEFAKMQIRAGADIIAISDPSGTGEILGPKLFEEFAVKYINQLVEGIREEKAATIVHICGQMKKVYPQVNKVTSDVLSFDSIVSIKEARENLGDRLLMGNVSTYTIEFGEPKKIRDLTKKSVKDGSNIIAPACGLGMKSPLQNVQAMRKALEEEENDDA